MKKIIYALVLVLALSACKKEKGISLDDHQKMQTQLDSIQIVLEVTQYNASLLDQMGKYMDSIDANRKWIQLNLETGLTQDDYVGRMKSLNEYVKKAEWTIGELEKTRSTYASQVKRMKKEIANKDLEIKSLQLTVANFQIDNERLQDLLTMTESDLYNSEAEVEIANQKIDEADIKVKNLLSTIRLTEAESYFAQGEHLEELAKSIQLAPKRKKTAWEEALSMYQKAADLGQPNTEEKITQLKGRLKMS